MRLTRREGEMDRQTIELATIIYTPHAARLLLGSIAMIAVHS